MPPDDSRHPRRTLPPNQRGTSGNGGVWNESNLGEVLFEFRPVGNYMRVNAIHAGTGREVFVLGPLNAGRGDLQLLALRKLKNTLNRQQG